MPLHVKFKIALLLCLAFVAPIAVIAIMLKNGTTQTAVIFSLIFLLVWIAECTYAVYKFWPRWDGWLVSMKRKYAGRKIACLTFDDGPEDPWTSQILDILRAKNVKATFFALGNKATNNPELLKKIVYEGHDIGNHSTHHKKIRLRSKRNITQDIIMASNTIAEISGRIPTLYRSPHGHKTFLLRRILRRLGLTLIPWTKGIWDTDGSNSEKLMERFCKHLEDFEILLLHDGTDASLTINHRRTTVEVLPKIIDEYKNEGYSFKKITEL